MEGARSGTYGTTGADIFPPPPPRAGVPRSSSTIATRRCSPALLPLVLLHYRLSGATVRMDSLPRGQRDVEERRAARQSLRHARVGRWVHRCYCRRRRRRRSRRSRRRRCRRRRRRRRRRCCCCCCLLHKLLQLHLALKWGKYTNAILAFLPAGPPACLPACALPPPQQWSASQRRAGALRVPLLLVLVLTP